MAYILNIHNFLNAKKRDRVSHKTSKNIINATSVIADKIVREIFIKRN